MSDTAPDPESDPRVAGLTLYLSGQFDPRQLAKSLGLQPIRMEFAATNTVLVCSGTKPPVSYPVSRRVTSDRLKVKVSGSAKLDSLFERLFGAVESLSGAPRSVWDKLEERTADLGLYWMNESNCGTEFDISRAIVGRLAQLNIALRISVYGHELAIDRAIQQRDEDRRDASA